MNLEFYKDFVLDDVYKRLELSETKSHDYASDEDTLINFKNVSKILEGMGFNVKPTEVCLVLIAVKLGRIGNLLKKGTPKNESLEDSIRDLKNYIDLFHALLYEETQEKGYDIPRTVVKFDNTGGVTFEETSQT